MSLAGILTERIVTLMSYYRGQRRTWERESIREPVRNDHVSVPDPEPAVTLSTDGASPVPAVFARGHINLGPVPPPNTVLDEGRGQPVRTYDPPATVCGCGHEGSARRASLDDLASSCGSPLGLGLEVADMRADATGIVGAQVQECDDTPAGLAEFD